MPIKFRCRFCRQFLGISRKKAGSVVDCPTCGRSLRVPDEDGVAKSVSQPRLDFEDPKFAAAIDQVASIGASDYDHRELRREAKQAAEIAQQKETKDAIVLPPAPEPVVEELPPPEPSAPAVRPRQSSKQIPAVRPKAAALGGMPAGPEEETLRPGAVLGDLLKDAEPAESMPAPKSEPKASSAWRQLLSPTVLAALGVCFVVSLLVGFLLGQRGGGKTADELKPETEQTLAAGKTPAEKTSDVPEPPVAAGGPQISGRILYRKDGIEKPDHEAVVIAVPVNLPPLANKLSAIDFKADDATSVEYQRILGDLKAAGCNAVRTDSDGRYRLPLTEKVEYRLVVVSAYQPRDESVVVDEEIRDALGRLFDRPQRIWGRLACHSELANLSEQATANFAHVF